MRLPRYFKRLLLFGVTLSLIPILFLGGFSYFQSSSSVIEKFSMQNKQSLNQSHLKTEQILEAIDYSLTQFMMSPSSRLIYRPLSVREFAEINELRQGINQLRIERYGIEDFMIMNVEQDWILSKEGFFSPSQLENHNPYVRFRDLANTSQWVVRDNGESTEISLVKKLPILTNEMEPKGIIAVTVKESKLSNLMLEDVVFGDMYIFDGDFQKIVSNNANSEEIAELASVLQQHQDGAEGEITAKLEHRNKIVNYRQSPYNDWIYVSVFAMDDATGELSSMAFMIVLFAVFILIVMSIIVFMGTRKMYDPIRKLYELSKHSGYSSQSDSEDELLLIQRRIDTLMKAKSKLNNKLEEQSLYLRDSLLLKMLLGSLNSSELERQGFRTNRSWKWITVISTQIDSPDVKQYDERDQSLILFAIDNIGSELVPPSQRIGTVVLDHTQIILLVGEQKTEQEFKRHVNRLADMIKNSIYNYLKIEVSIGIGRRYDDVQYVSKSYKESLDALKYRFRLGSNVVLHVDEILNQTYRGKPYPKHLENHLLNSIKKMDRSESKKFLHQFLDELTKEEIAYEEFQLNMLQLLTSITGIMNEHDQSFLDIADTRISFEQFFAVYSEIEISEWLYKSIIEPIIDYLEKESMTKYANFTDTIIQIIHQDFTSDLSLEYCASRVNFHPSYVSRVFKKETGITFSEYLSNYRLKMAEKWLVETNMNVSEIAEKLKYNSSAAFIRYFRKMKQMTPGEFRKKHLQKSS